MREAGDDAGIDGRRDPGRGSGWSGAGRTGTGWAAGRIAPLLALAMLVLAALVPALTPTAARADTPPAVVPADRAAVEGALDGALITGRPNSSVTRGMPSGSKLEIVVSEPFTRRTGAPCIGCKNPCRTFQYRYIRPDRAAVVVEGARCHRPSGRWITLQADRIVSERPAQPGLAMPLGPAQGRDSGPSRPTQNLAAVPLPPARPAEAGADAPAATAGDGAAAPAAEVAAAEPSGVTATGEPSDPAAAGSGAAAPAAEPQPPAAEPQPPAAAAQPGAPAGTEVAALAPPADGVRQAVPNPAAGGADAEAPPAPAASPAASPESAAAPAAPAAAAADKALEAPVEAESVSDPTLVRLLRQLAYLDPATATDPSRREVRAAVADFAADERLTLPMPQDELIARLEAAVDRVAALSSCQNTSDTYGVCFTGP